MLFDGVAIGAMSMLLILFFALAGSDAAKWSFSS
jgi:hypothetical protein